MKHEYKKEIKKIIKTNALINPANPFLNNRVLDATYDYGVYINQTFQWLSQKRQYNHCICQCIPSILVILESPHINEFDKNGKPILPLMKDDKFRKYFSKQINMHNINLSQRLIYQVVFVNAIQLQCSLGLPTAYYRDYVFLYYWERLYKDFERRLMDFIYKCNIACVINACTIGGHENCTSLYNYKQQKSVNMYKSCGKKFVKELNINNGLINNNTNMGAMNKNVYTLKSLVNNSITNVIKSTRLSIPIYWCAHPSSWH